MFRRVFAVAVACALLLLAGPAAAQEASATTGVREHDGFFLQLQYGGGYLNLAEERFSVYGPGTGLNVLVGGSPITNLALFGEVFAQIAPAPTADSGGRSRSDRSAQLTFTNIGPGAAYYLGETNIYLSGMVGFAGVELSAGGRKATANGVGFRLGLGKEWWVSDQWGIGLAGNFFQATVVDSAKDVLTARSFGLSFSATYQ